MESGTERRNEVNPSEKILPSYDRGLLHLEQLTINTITKISAGNDVSSPKCVIP